MRAASWPSLGSGTSGSPASPRTGRRRKARSPPAHFRRSPSSARPSRASLPGTASRSPRCTSAPTTRRRCSSTVAQSAPTSSRAARRSPSTRCTRPSQSRTRRAAAPSSPKKTSATSATSSTWRRRARRRGRSCGQARRRRCSTSSSHATLAARWPSSSRSAASARMASISCSDTARQSRTRCQRLRRRPGPRRLGSTGPRCWRCRSASAPRAPGRGIMRWRSNSNGPPRRCRRLPGRGRRQAHEETRSVGLYQSASRRPLR
mmetsp:Transcript_32907/g.105550  ORF Transcript_32907/g.105550 Transcript_32907/m.105550 type:complete len:262 (-) Transcript_32907:114-899(-)